MCDIKHDRKLWVKQWIFMLFSVWKKHNQEVFCAPKSANVSFSGAKIT